MSGITETTLELDLNALDHNYHFLRSRIKSTTRMLGVVKAFGYGSDSIEVAKELVSLGVDYFGVAYAKEGEALRDAKIETPILVLHPLPANFPRIVSRCLEPSLYSIKVLKKFIDYAESEDQKEYPVHLKLNTGLNRLGFSENELEEVLKILKKTPAIKVKSLFSHLAASEDPNELSFSEDQISCFHRLSERIIDFLGYQPLRHMLNTSGVINYPSAEYDMVRSGIGLYGFGNDAAVNSELKPVACLKTVISQIHHISKGDTVGYNRAYTASEEMRTATLPLGHADGISRAYGNGAGWVKIHGQKAPIAGNVCMDMIMVDVTNIDCEEGDEVVIFGSDPTAEELASAINTISYELLTAISQRVKRVVHRKP